ncbi:MAG TPA: toll/interleukin-1 receptor domain-containing protein, partial [Lamprocystis sp. (in: g-proteobacteria)]|nr:toll/interleukin-1 receptor domain-containing protein [Lamprocystis sp. (in: g-proteobacteria)]
MPADVWDQSERDHERPFELFISYSHKREAVKDRLCKHFSVLEGTLLSTWTDRAIRPGAPWREEIEAAILRADAALFVVCEDFLASGFCLDTELAAFLRRQREEGVLLLFVLADHCLWESLPAIAERQMVPRDGKPIVAYTPRSKAYTAVVREIRQVLEEHRTQHGLRYRAPAPAAPTDRTQGALAALLAELPGATPRLFGRDAELARMDTQLGGGPGGVLLWVAPGGVGKSALTRQWLGSRDWPPGTRFIGHSFYSQGSRDQTVSARAFLLRALAALGEQPEPTTSDADLGRLLAECAAQAPTVLALDGLEPRQQASSDPKLNGRLKDLGLAALLEGLGRAPGQAVCLASSRLAVPDLLIESQPHFRSVRLDVLPRPGSVALLEARGLDGTPAE